jgi:hypothetical protein
LTDCNASAIGTLAETYVLADYAVLLVPVNLHPVGLQTSITQSPCAWYIYGRILTEHDLKQSDLPEVGSQGVVSEILSGKRDLNVRQMRALAKRFGVSPAVFI